MYSSLNVWDQRGQDELCIACPTVMAQAFTVTYICNSDLSYSLLSLIITMFGGW